MRSPFYNKLREVRGGLDVVAERTGSLAGVVDVLRNHLEDLTYLACELEAEDDELESVAARIALFDEALSRLSDGLRDECEKIATMSHYTDEVFGGWADRPVRELFRGYDYEEAEVVASSISRVIRGRQE